MFLNKIVECAIFFSDVDGTQSDSFQAEVHTVNAARKFN